MKKKFLFSLLLFATCFFSATAQNILSEDFSSTAWKAEILRLNSTYVTPVANACFTGLSSTAVYKGKYLLNGAIESRSANPNCADALITHRNTDNGGVAVAFRFRSGTAPVLDTYIEFPEVTSAGNITLHVRNGNTTTNTSLYLQKYVSGVWSTIKTYTIYRSDNYSSTSVDEIKTFDINSTIPIKLRLVGGDKFIDLFRVDIDAHYKAVLLTTINSATTQRTANAGNIGTTLGTYSQASYDTFGTAITAANTVNANGSATQAQVDAAVVTLNAAVATFQASVNKVDLQTGITTATTLKNANTGNIGTGLGQYTQASYDALGAAITAASAVNTNVIATGAQVIAALATLNTAVATFQESVNKVGLQTGITTATTLKNASTSKIGGGLGQYTQASYDALVAAIAAATAVNANATATGAEVIAALATLNTAIGTFQSSVIPVELLQVNFTADSTYWKSEFPATTWNGPNLSVAVSAFQFDGYSFNGTFGKFDPGAGVMAQPIRNDAQSSHRRWAFRLDNNGTSYIELPSLTSAGKMTVWCKNGNISDESTIYIQQKIGSTWTTIKTIFVPPHYDRDYEQQVEEYININSAITLRIYGATKNTHVYKIVVNSYDATKPAAKPCKLILLPDPQNYANNSNFTHIYGKQNIWIANNSDSIKFVLCQGDMTQLNSDEHWSIAAGAFNIMEAKKLPFTFIPGNHDLGSPTNSNTRNSTMLNTYMPYSRYSRDPSFGGAYEVGKMENTWSTFSYGEYNFLILSLEFAVRNKVLDWAGTIISAHPNHNIIINTHAFMGQDNQPLSGRWDNGISNDTGVEYANDAQEMWDKRFKQHKNVLFIFSGHILGTGEGHRVTAGVNGNKVYQFAANYQTGVDGSVEGGNGFLRIVDMDPANHILNIQTYSPYIDQYDLSANQHFYYNNVQYMKNNGQYAKGQLTDVENRNSDKITVSMEGKNLKIANSTGAGLTTVVYTMQGVKMLERSGSETGNIALPVSGCYIISISDKSGMYTFREKIIVP